MFKKLIYLVSFVLVLGLAGDVQAATTIWSDSTDDHNWFTAINWSIGTVPTSADWAIINMLPGPIIANEGAVVNGLSAGGSDAPGALTVDGGTLTANATVNFAWSEGTNATLNMISGTLTAGWNFNVGTNGSATLNVTGGTITVGNVFSIPESAQGTGHVNLDGGIITVNNLLMRANDGSVGTMDIRTGTLISDGNDLSLIQGYIDHGWITAYDGGGTLNLDYDITNRGKTTLKAVHLLNPNPFDGGLVSPGEVELSWTLPDPCVPGQPVPVDVYFTDDLQALEWFTDPAAMQIVSKQNVTSVIVQAQIKTRYYWTVDTYIGDPNDPIFGPIFSFFVDNQTPEVDTGTDVVTWLVDGVRIKNLDGTVTDDGAIMPYTAQWTLVSEPNDPNSPDAVIADPSVEDTSITLSALGEYVLQLEAFDGEYTGSDTVTINVYNDGCEAAQSQPHYEPFPGDLNGDCKVDVADLELLLEDWLKDNSLVD